jgi:hypothetical protein
MKKLLLILSLVIASCTTRTATEDKKDQTAPAINLDQQTLDAVMRCINDESAAACSLTAEGSITLKDGGSSQSGHFELKSKRLQGLTMPQRVDSLSMVVTGPFGITGAKFLGAPEEYQFYNAIEGEKYRGRPDPKTLQSMTGMKGLTLESLSDVIYGIAPSATQLAPGDAVTLNSLSEYRHIIFIQRGSGISEAITVNGKLPTANTPKAKLTIVQYDRWNRMLSFENSRNTKADISVFYQGVFENKDFSLPSIITARSGSTELEIEYMSADQNPKELTVKIKMPK